MRLLWWFVICLKRDVDIASHLDAIGFHVNPRRVICADRAARHASFDLVQVSSLTQLHMSVFVEEHFESVRFHGRASPTSHAVRKTTTRRRFLGSSRSEVALDLGHNELGGQWRKRWEISGDNAEPQLQKTLDRSNIQSIVPILFFGREYRGLNAPGHDGHNARAQSVS